MKASVLALAFLCLAGCASAASDPTCANGLKASHAGETICCAASCGVCGGPRCATQPGGAAKCCPSAIKAAATSCKAAEAPCIVDGVSKQAVTLTTEQLQKYVLEMNKLDINGVITGQQAKSLTSLNDVILYSKTAPSWDIKRATKALYVPPARLPEMEVLQGVKVEVEIPPLPEPMPPAGALTSCHGGKVSDLDAYYQCKHITGGLFVIDLDIENLDQLKGVESVSGPLVIKNNKNLKDITGLRGIKGHVESIGIYKNPQLQFVDGLEGVTSTGSVMISDNEELVKLNALAHVCGELQHGIGIRNNPKLVNLDGLACLNKLGATGEGIAVEIDGNNALENIEALNHVQELEGAALITRNKELKSIKGLSKVTTIGRDKKGNSLVLVGNSKLSECDAFTMATKLPGAVTAYNNANLKAMSCLAKVTNVGRNGEGAGVVFAKNPKLAYAGLDDVTDVAGSVIISDTALSHLSAAVLASIGKDKQGHSLQIAANKQLASASLAKLARTPGSVQVWNNAQLRSTGLYNLMWVGADAKGVSVELANNKVLKESGLRSLSTTTGGVAFTGNSALSTTGLVSLAKVGGAKSNGNCLEVVDNKGLKALDTSKLTACKGGVKFQGNKALTDLGLGKVTFLGKNAVGQSVVVMGNGALQTLKGFPAATKLEGSLVVNANPSLTSMKGAEKVGSVGKDKAGDSIEIAHNDLLETVAALKNAKVYAGALSIQSNPKLKALDLGVQGINGKNLLGDSILIAGNSELVNLNGLDNLHGSLEGAISITDNGRLEHLHGLGKIAAAGPNVYGNSMEIVRNKRLQDLTGLRIGGTVKGAIVVSNNGALKSLRGLCGVSGIAGKNAAATSLSLSENPKLIDAKCLENLGGLISGNIDLSGTNLATVTPLAKGKNPITKVLGDIKVNMLHCLPNEEASFLKKLCSTSACRDRVARANLCSFSGKGSNVLVGSGTQKPCGGSSNTGWKSWKSAGSSGLYIDVDTSRCNFALTPGYVTSVQGDAGHWQLVGVNSIYSATRNGFRVYVWHPKLRGSYLQYFAKRYNWRINWVADASQKAGVTRPGKSGWKQFAKDTVYVDVNTKPCGYTGTPSLVTALHGARDHWRTQGVHSIYRATATGFRVYVSHANTKLTAAQAESYNWAVAWIGSNDSKRSGFSSADWKLYCGDHGACQDAQNYFALSMDVETKAAQRMNVKSDKDITYVTSVSGSGPHLLATGGASLYRPTSSGFRVYLSHAPTAQFAKDNNWKVNWLAYAKPRDCQLASWGIWGKCSKKCGGGTQTRTRKTLVKASAGGYCPTATQSKTCNDWSCALDCQMGSWGSWGSCSVTCGHGSQRRTRAIKRAGQPGGKKCPPSTSVKLCAIKACPVHCKVSQWGAFSPCTKTCGGGWHVRSRHVVQNAQSAGTACPKLTEKADCNKKGCPVDCKLAAWGAWGQCNKSCGGGFRLRARKVLVWPKNDGKACEAFNEAEVCNEWDCKNKCRMTGWTEWSACSVSCGVGTQKRTRAVRMGRVDRKESCPATSATRECFEGTCPVSCKVAAWGSWTKCTKECGGGRKARMREVLVKGNQNDCPLLSEAVACNSHNCPQDCKVSGWSRWTPCTKTCGKGTQSRDRAIVLGAVHGGKKCPWVSEKRSCNVAACPVNCVMNAWKDDWTICNQKCGLGTQTRTRTVKSQAAHGGAACLASKQTRQCMIRKCPKVCNYAAWGSWTPCPANYCQDGKQVRTRVNKDKKRATQCPAHVESRICPKKKCNDPNEWQSRDCTVSAWSKYGKCSKTCGNGRMTRTRTVLKSARGTGKQCPPLKEDAHCGQPCPIDCLVGSWSDYGACSHTCGAGIKTKTRRVVRAPRYNGKKCPALTLKSSCNVANCPVNCEVSKWHAWTECSHKCGGGYQSRQRSIVKDSKFNGARCPALKEERQCNWHRCPVNCMASPWSGYGTCSATCGAGSKMRTRKVLMPAAFGGLKCGALVETAKCNAGPCPSHCDVTNWGGYSTCTATCGGGKQTRERAIKNNWTKEKAWGGRICPSLKETRDCGNTPCPRHCVLGYWGKWNQCTHSCGGGTKRRTRPVVVYPAFGGAECKSQEATVICNTKVCPVDCNQSNWGVWSSCRGKCGEQGERTRFRLTYRKSQGTGKPCGVTQQRQTCTVDRCPRYCDVSQWAEWSACTKSCEYGRRSRTRKVLAHDVFAACPKLVQEQDCNTQKCPVDCKYTLWGAWEPFFGGGQRLRRTRQITRAAAHNGKPCPTSLRQFKTSKWCKNVDKFSSWGVCSRGYQYRHREHMVCSSSAQLKYHYTFRQGRHCSVVAAGMRLDEEIDLSQEPKRSWATLSMDEVKQYGLPTGHWQKLL